MKINPLGDRIVMKNLEAEETTKGGILLTNSAKEKPQMAEVLAVGPGGNVDGKEITMHVKAGQKVIYSKYAGTEVKLDGEEYILVRQSDVLAVVECHFAKNASKNREGTRTWQSRSSMARKPAARWKKASTRWLIP